MYSQITAGHLQEKNKELFEEQIRKVAASAGERLQKMSSEGSEKHLESRPSQDLTQSSIPSLQVQYFK